MAGLCLTAGALAATLPLTAFTLAWTHSIEKVRWEEDYRIVDGRLLLSEARIVGGGAGMQPPADAMLRNGVWHYRPALAPLARLTLSHSPYAGEYQICAAGSCRELADVLPGIAAIDTVVIAACVP